MPRVSKRMKYKRIYCCHTRLERRICPTCGAEVTKWSHQRKVEHCFRCRKCLVWDSATKVLVSRIRGRPTLKYSGRGSPAMSTIEERSEPGADRSRPSSGASPIDNDLCTPDDDSLRSWITVTSQDMGCSVSGDGDGDAVTAFESVETDTKEDAVSARHIGSIPPKDEQLTINIWETTNETNTAALLPATAIPEPITDTPHPTSPRTTSPSPTPPHPPPPRPVPRKKSCRFGQRFRRKRPEPMEPRPSLEDLISIPEVVPRQRAAELLNTLMLARHVHGQFVSTEPITASPAIVPQEPGGLLEQQHAANLHNALARLEALEVDSSSNEGSASSGGSSFWSQMFCFL